MEAYRKQSRKDGVPVVPLPFASLVASLYLFDYEPTPAQC